MIVSTKSLGGGVLLWDNATDVEHSSQPIRVPYMFEQDILEGPHEEHRLWGPEHDKGGTVVLSWVTWVDSESGQTHLLLSASDIFIMNDNGKTIQRVRV